MDHKLIKMLMKANGFREEAIGLFQSEQFDFIFDCNSGGLKVIDLDGDVIDWGVSEDDASPAFVALIEKHANINNRADLPF